MPLWIEDGQKLFECEVDALAMALKRDGVVSGAGVTASSPADMNVNVAAGQIRSSDTLVSILAAALAVGAADATNPRKDIVVSNSSGALSIVAGVAAAVPKPPALPSGSILLAVVDVAAGATAINTADIHDRRLLLPAFGTNSLSDASVTTAKVADASVTAAKVASDVATQAELDALIQQTSVDYPSAYTVNTPPDKYPLTSVFRFFHGNTGGGFPFYGHVVTLSREDTASVWQKRQAIHRYDSNVIQVRRGLAASKPVWAASTAYAVNDLVMPTSANENGHYYKCTTAGTSGSAEPTWPTTSGATVTDGTVVWTEYGKFWGEWDQLLTDGDYNTRSAFRAYQSTAQSIAATTWTKVAYQTEVFDNQTEYDTTNYRFTAKKAGIYSVSANVLWSSATSGSRQIMSIYKNGSEEFRGFDDARGVAGDAGSFVSANIKLNAGDYIEIFVYTTAALSTIRGNQLTGFSMTKIA